METFSDLKKEVNNLSGGILLIGDLNSKNFPISNKNKLTDIYYLNGDDDDLDDEEIDTKDIASNIHLRELHKYFKEGIDNIYCNYLEVKSYFPSFFRESLRITKKNIYLVLKNKNDYKRLAKKYGRYNITCNLYSFKKCNIMVIEANDIIVNPFKEIYYYIIDSIEKAYNYISDQI